MERRGAPPTPAFSSAMGTDGSYMGQSRMTVTRQSWETGDVYTCQVTHPAVETELSMHNASKCLAASRIAWKVDGQVSSVAKTETLKKNSNGTTNPDITMSNTGIREKEPSVTVSQADHKDISGNRVSLTLICEASRFYPEEISMS
ncbi:unnamed protein product [Eretmochelys imbricata]